MTVRRSSATPAAFFRAAILVIAPAVMLVGHGSHPWIGNPGDPGFFGKLAATVAADPTRWWVSHFLIAVGSGLLALAFLALRGYLRETGEDRWSALGIPFIVMGSMLYALLPAMEFAPLAAIAAGADAAAIQAAQMPWFVPILQASALLFGLGVLGFMLGVARSGVLSQWLRWLVLGALAVLAATRFFPVGAAQLYVGPAASVVALWPLAWMVWRHPVRRAHQAERPAQRPPAAGRRRSAGPAGG